MGRLKTLRGSEVGTHCSIIFATIVMNSVWVASTRDAFCIFATIISFNTI